MSKKWVTNSHKARWKGKTVKQLIDLMFTFEVIIPRTEEESQAISEAVQVLDDLIKEKLTGVK